jgi:GNAT superfamily N-acetyltransferase
VNSPTDNNLLAVAAIDDGDIAEVIALWQRCGSPRAWNDPAADIALARRESNSTVLVGRKGGDLVASVLVGHDGHRGWVYYVTVDPEQRFKGYGRLIMSRRKTGCVRAASKSCSSWSGATTQKSTPSTSPSAIMIRNVWCLPNGSTAASRRRSQIRSSR